MLNGLRVIDLSQTVAGAYATKLLVDAWADVIKVEPPGGDPLRHWPDRRAVGEGTAADAAFFRYLTASKRARRADEDELVELAAEADVLVEDLGPGAVPVEALRAANPRLVVVSISPFGHTGPWAERAGNEFTVQGWCASTFGRGTPDRLPLQAGGNIGSFAAASFAAVAALAAWRQARRTGVGEHVDVSLLESTFSVHHPYIYLADRLGKVPFGGGDGPFVEVPSVVRTADGYVGFCTVTAQQLHGFFILIERPDLIADAELGKAQVRFDRRDELIPAIEAWSTRHTTDDVVARAAELRVPCAPVAAAADLFAFDHYRHRGVFVESAHGFLQPRVPYRVGQARPRPFGPAPSPDDSSEPVTWTPRESPSPPPPAGPGGAPYSGLRIVDLTNFIAGPSATQVLGAFGADVIKVESIQHPDGLRFVTSTSDADRWWEHGAIFQIYNRGKRDLTLDLGRDEGRALLLRAVAEADVVIENFTPRVLEQFGLDWETIHAANPRAILVRMPGFGLDGPWRDRPGFAQTMEQVTGMAAVTGFADGPPVLPRGPCDVIASLHAVVALNVALEERERTGEGQMVELAMFETILNIAAEISVELSANGRDLTRDGNRSRTAAPQGVYSCPGEKRWLALSVEDDEQWKGLKAALGDPAWAQDPELDSAAGRRAHHDALDGHLARWALGLDRDEAVEHLARHGVPAAPVLRQQSFPDLPQNRARHFFEELTHPLLGTHPFPSLPFRFAGRAAEEPWLPTTTPQLGQHNDEVLSELGLVAEEITALREAGLIGDTPAGM